MPDDMLVYVTALYALPLIVVFLILWISVTKMRAGQGISIGDGGNPELLLRIRRHGNFIEWVPFTLLLMLIAELMGAPAIYLHISGALLVIGRIVHPFGLKPANASHPLRIVGNSANILSVLNLSVCLCVRSFDVLTSGAA